MNRLKKKLPYNYFHYYLFSIIIALLCSVNIFFVFLYIPYFFLIRNYRKKHIIIIVTTIFGVYSSLYIETFNQKPHNNEFIIINKIDKETYYTYTVKQKWNKYLFYYDKDLSIGDILVLDYTYEEFTPSQTPNGFNLKHYYKSKRIYYKLNIKDLKVIDNKFHINKIRFNLKERLNKYPPYTKNYLKLFLFADDSFEEDYKEAKRSLGIAHLFALSGMHITFFIGIIEFVCKKLDIKLNKYVMFILLFLYLWLADFTISLQRAVLMYVLYELLKNKGLTKLDSLSLSFIILVIINPFYVYRAGFILSYLVSFLLVITPTKNTFKEVIVTHYKIMMLTILIISNLNGGIYVFSLLTSLIFTLIFPIIIMPLIFIGLIFPLSVIIEPLLNGFSNVLLLLNNSLLIKLPYQSVFSIFLYVVLFIYVIYELDNKTFLKRSLLLFLYTLIVYVSPNFNFNQSIYFLDVNQGDATFIQNTNNKGNILIDANKGTLEFLKTLGDIKIECFFITHGDSDHAIEAEQIIKEFKIKNIYISPYDDSTIINNLKKYNAKPLQAGTSFTVNDIKIKVLGPLTKYSSLNNNSLILQMIINNKTYLFTGDAEKEAIADLINTYSKGLKSDFLHVSHHGAKGCSPEEFLVVVSPSEAVISVGKNNFYNHPHPETINNLKQQNIKVYLTSKQQTIIKKKYNFSLREKLVKLFKI